MSNPDSQSTGVGRLLLAYLQLVAYTAGIHQLSLHVLRSNPNAIRFYQKNGFTQETLVKDEFFINGHFCDDDQFAYFPSESV